MTKRLFFLSLFFGLIIFFAIGCNDGGGGGGNSCDGPVPCLTSDWGDTMYEFEEDDGNPIVIGSDGLAFGGAGVTDDGFIMALGGEVVGCYTGNILVGGMDYNLDGTVDEWFDTASGNVKICDTELKITNLILNGVPNENIVAEYVGVARSMMQSGGSDSAQAIISETLDRLRDE
jgi:hypothetical protein